MSNMPTLFLSHGSPTIVIDDTPPRHFLEDLAQHVPAPRAIVIASAHFETEGPAVVSDPSPGMIYDFGGFPDELYQMEYRAPGSPEIAAKVVKLLENSKLSPTVFAERGYDHGTWTPLKLAWPEANIPVVQVSIDPNRDAAYHYKLGQALSTLREEGILLIGSGHITHNLRAVFGLLRGNEKPDPKMVKMVGAFTNWFAEKLTGEAPADVLRWREEAPFVSENHPTDEHLMPIFFALGAAGESARGERLHSSALAGIFASDFYKFH